MKHIHTYNAMLLALIALGLQAQGCSSKDKVQTKGKIATGPIPISWPSSDREELRDTEVPPFAINAQGFAGSGRFNSVFWIDFEGADVTGEESFIVKNAGLDTVAIPPFFPSDIGSNDNRESLKLAIIQALVPLFPDVDIKLTLTRPTEKLFSHVLIGGDNFTKKPGILGISPLDLGNRNGNDILFIYPLVLKNIGNSNSARVDLTHAIAHEIAHSLGARHIENDQALMRTAVAVDANSFNLTGPVVDNPGETENSLAVLLNSAGSRSKLLNDRSLPEIVTLDAFATDNVIQYTVIANKNILQNPAKSLAAFAYKWAFEGKTTEGSSVLIKIDDKAEHLLKLTVGDGQGATHDYEFSVGHRR